MLTAPLPQGGAVQLGRSLAAVDAVLRRLRLILALVCLGGTALAAALGRLVSRSFVAPIVNVTEAARHIAETEDLGRRIAVTSQDEVGELAAHFNAMLDTLEGSIAAQRQLVADASHELRTPITSLRTNIEVLAETEDLPRDERARLLADIEEQIDGARHARGRPDRAGPRRPAAPRHRGCAAGRAGGRGRRPGAPPRAGRALRDAAGAGRGRGVARPAGPRGEQPARQRGQALAGRRARRGRRPGLPACASATTATGVDDQDIPHLFDRFYRGVSARGRPGSGLGLAIVRQVAEQHQGSVRAANAPGGGAEFVLTLPAVAPSTGELWATPSA